MMNKKTSLTENQQVSTLVSSLIPIPGYENYFTDGYGNIFSKARKDLKKLSAYEHFGKSRNAYMRVKVKGRLWLVHRLIALIIIQRPFSDGDQVNHIDGNTKNNSLLNLEVVSMHENVRHAVQNNLYCKGDDWYRARGLNKK